MTMNIEENTNKLDMVKDLVTQDVLMDYTYNSIGRYIAGVRGGVLLNMFMR